MTYKELLQTKEWQNKRKLILKRDNYQCTTCNSKDNLHVHHKYYLEGKMPWEVPDDCLVTLCKICHKKEHKGKNIKSFIKKHPPKNNIKKLNKKRREYNNMLNKLSKEGKIR
jgi:5-methylcytosine-specific restriction endonuclease McrA